MQIRSLVSALCQQGWSGFRTSRFRAGRFTPDFTNFDAGKRSPFKRFTTFFCHIFLSRCYGPANFPQKNSQRDIFKASDYINLVQVSVHAGTVVIVPSWPLEAGAIVMTLDITNNMQVSVTTHRVCTGDHPVQALALLLNSKELSTSLSLLRHTKLRIAGPHYRLCI